MNSFHSGPDINYIDNGPAGAGYWYQKCMPYLRQLAESGDAVLQFEIGNTYNNGYGVQLDHVEAMRWYRKSADQGYASAMAELAYWYSMGNSYGFTIIPEDDALLLNLHA